MLAQGRRMIMDFMLKTAAVLLALAPFAFGGDVDPVYKVGHGAGTG
jgi:hypothetical protein